MIPQSFIQELLARVDIVDVVGKAVRLKKAGANLQGLCPFHNEKSPSFTVSPAKQFYHCFGCGAHGSAISFLMEHHGLGFVEAVHELAGDAGLSVPRAEGTGGEAAAPRRNASLTQWLEMAAAYYRQRLKETPAAIDYLKARGLSGETARTFGLGYAPAGWRNLDGVLPDYAAEEAETCGLVVAAEDGKRYDRFRERVLFPIRNTRGQVIGFGGRVLGQGEPKYLNSPEGPLFSKRRELYGLFEAREAIRSQQRVLVVEGYMDVVMLHQHGCAYAVATLGTAMTAEHLVKLLRLSDRIVFSFDGDAAGRRAAWRALENALPLLSDTKRLDFLFLPPEHDPDSYVRSHGLAAFEALVAEALPMSAFLVRELTGRVDLATPEGRARMQAELKPLVAQMPDIALRTQIVLDMASRLGVQAEDLFAYCGIRVRAAGADSGGGRRRPSGRTADWAGDAGRARDGGRQSARRPARQGGSWPEAGDGEADGWSAYEQVYGSYGAGSPASAAASASAGGQAGPSRRQGRDGDGPWGRAPAGPAAWQEGSGHSGEAAAWAGSSGQRSAWRGEGRTAGRSSGWPASGTARAAMGHTRPMPPSLQQHVCLLLAYYPVLAHDELADRSLLPETVLRWRDQLGALPDGVRFAGVLMHARSISPGMADFIETLDARDAGVLAAMTLEEARTSYQVALCRLKLNGARHESEQLVREGLDKPGVAARYAEVEALKQRLTTELAALA